MIKKIFVFIVVLCSTVAIQAQDAKAIIRQCNSIYGSIKEYSCSINLVFDIPGLNIGKIDGKVYFKKPNRFKIKTKGIAFLPKQNPSQIPQIIADTVNFIAVFIGKETVSNQLVDIIQMVPLKENDVVAAKFYINTKGQILKAQISTKSNGTSDIANEYNDQVSTRLPSASVISFDMKKFKIPKMMAVDINSKIAKKTTDNKTTGSVTMKFSGYKMNQTFADNVFEQKE